jgi:hypothetical protein
MLGFIPKTPSFGPSTIMAHSNLFQKPALPSHGLTLTWSPNFNSEVNHAQDPPEDDQSKLTLAHAKKIRTASPKKSRHAPYPTRSPKKPFPNNLPIVSLSDDYFSFKPLPSKKRTRKIESLVSSKRGPGASLQELVSPQPMEVSTGITLSQNRQKLHTRSIFKAARKGKKSCTHYSS